MGIFDVFTGAPARRAAEQTRQYLGGVQTQGLADLASGYSGGQDFIRSGTAGARGDIAGGYDTARGDVAGGFSGAQGFLGQSFGSGMDALNRGRAEGTAAYQPLSELAGRYGQGSALYSDALGINGAGGNQRAQQAFTTSPGYQFQMDQSLDAINRARNASGQLVGGNTDDAVLTKASGLANQEWGGYLNRLQGFQPLELQATSGAAGGLADIARTFGMSEADLMRSLGGAQAGLAERGGTSLGQLATGQGTALGGLASQEGQSLASLASGQANAATGLRTNLAQPYANTYGQEAAAQQQGSANLWGGILNGAMAAGRMAGGMPPGGMPGGAGAANAGVDGGGYLGAGGQIYPGPGQYR